MSKESKKEIIFKFEMCNNTGPTIVIVVVAICVVLGTVLCHIY